MTIDEAIEHAKDVARTCNDNQCAAEHIQLAEWLRQARGADKAARWYTEKIRKLEAENSMLRELENIRMTQVEHCESLTEEIEMLEAENAKLRKLVVRMFHTIEWSDRMSGSMYWPSLSYEQELRELGIEVSE